MIPGTLISTGPFWGQVQTTTIYGGGTTASAMSSIGAGSKNRKLGDELPHPQKRRDQKLPEKLAQDIIRDGQEKTLYVFTTTFPSRGIASSVGAYHWHTGNCSMVMTINML